MNKHKISKIMLLSGAMYLLFTTNISALENKDVYDEILSVYSDRTEYDSYFLKILQNSNISKKEHKRVIDEIKNYTGTQVEKWWLLESERLIFNDVIFSIPSIKNNYYDKLNNYGQSSLYAYSVVKKDLIGSLEQLKDLFELSLKEYSNLEEIFFNHFKRNPTSNELSWLKNKNIKYSLYGGALGREITEQERKQIDTGEGYKLLGISKSEKDIYKELIEKHNKFETKELTYKRAYQGLKNIRYIVSEFYKLDIFDILTVLEREEIYIKSIEKYKFNEKSALELTFNLLKEKDLIKDDITDWPDDIIKPELPTDKPIINTKPGINDDLTSNNPLKDFYDYIQDLDKNSIYKSLRNPVSELYNKTNNSTYDKKYIYFKYNNMEFNTNIILSENDTLTDTQMKYIISVITEKLNGKVVYAKEKIMVLLGNLISITDILKEGNNIKFDKLDKFMNSINIDLYLKSIE